MIILFHRNFKKQFQKLKAGEKSKLKERLELFLVDIFNPSLNNHPLKGKYAGYRSINISGDLRAIYKQNTKDAAIFVAVDSHNHLYQ
ncbi:MAG: type II toxin-antitoxin system RelE/ParE family toxin [bacterium]|nr:type II toxin-antitoxin system RelE/ParE family toxin [bacterium]